ncbi:ubiquitin-conjugating enzyme E2 2-like [Ostrea edulis]|uniref:ubiquitin-conjugating enzyme E2 2-like n=1 Tax=Ostrea edulis TaxID=37623 RepID=UPI00209641A0|nr:ubiquitin-conjugating enzyme E2 2-like [Ostrea edulis]
MALKLIAKQLEKLYQEIPEDCGFTAGPLEDDMLHWEASIPGPEESPYKGGRFWLRIDFTADYPFRPPKIFFLTKVFHPNVEPDGKICVDFLQDEWKPSYTIGYILMAICSLLLHPNPEKPASQEVANIYISDQEQFTKTAAEWTKLHAPPDV